MATAPAGTRHQAERFTTRGEGWVLFAALVLGLSALLEIAQGILAVADSRVFARDAVFIFSDLNTWGWLTIVFGVLLAVAAAGVVNGSEVARWFAIAVAALNGIDQLLWIQAYPWSSVAMFALDVLVIYALAVYGGGRLYEP
jgi:hypothetical protein